MIPINAPKIDEKEVEAVAKVLRSGILTGRVEGGPMVKKFESEFSKFVRTKYAVAVNSGTAALHLSLLAANVGFGDEVIVPSFTFIATAEAAVLAGAKPVFVDINPNTYNIDPEKIEEAITSRTKALIAVDLYGLPADMKPISEIALKHGLTLIEDAAQAHGASYKGKPAGSYADIACWSFYASKNMTTGEGGMITTNNAEYAEKIRCMRAHGEKEEYMSSMIGHNYRMPEMEAAIGCIQLSKLPSFLEKRRRNAEELTKNLGENETLQLPIEPKGFKSSWYLYTVRLKNAEATKRNALVEKLRKKGIGATVYYPTPIHLMPYYRQFGSYSLPETEKASQQIFSLPIHPGVTLEQINYISRCVLQFIE